MSPTSCAKNFTRKKISGLILRILTEGTLTMTARAPFQGVMPSARQMGLAGITAESLAQELGKEIPVAYVLLAKHRVLGTDIETLCEILDVAKTEILELESTELFREIRAYVAGRHAETLVNQSTGWDGVEAMGIQGLLQKVQHSQDPEFLLRAAAVANKAIRRVGQAGVLDPRHSTGTVVITLTKRLAQNLISGEGNNNSRQPSVIDGTATNPRFEEVDSFLQVQVKANGPAPERHIDDVVRDILNSGELG